MTDKWMFKVVRWITVPETRFFHRHILRRRTRDIEEVVFAQIPERMRLSKSINKPDEFSATIRACGCIEGAETNGEHHEPWCPVITGTFMTLPEIGL